MVGLQQRIDRALALRRQGFNCAQTVTMVFDDLPGVPDSSVFSRISAAFGGGIGGQGMVCGALTGALIIDGLIAPEGTTKAASYARARDITASFAAPYGTCQCKELKGSVKVPCEKLIVDAITLIHNRISAK